MNIAAVRRGVMITGFVGLVGGLSMGYSVIKTQPNIHVVFASRPIYF
jgi:hypothetical protein